MSGELHSIQAFMQCQRENPVLHIYYESTGLNLDWPEKACGAAGQLKKGQLQLIN